MAKPMHKAKVNYNSATVHPRKVLKPSRPIVFKPKVKKVNPLKKIVLFLFSALLLLYVFPYGYNKFLKPLFFSSSNNAIKTDYNLLYNKTSAYLNNDYFLGKKLLKSANLEKPQMQTLYLASPMQVLTARLNRLMSSYPIIKPTIFIWDFETGKYVDINANQQYPAASIIKIPILLELFRSIESSQINLYDKLKLTDYYKAEGSGGLQYKPVGSYHTVDALARTMIQDSDNSATNMLMSSIGGKIDINRAIRHWGLNDTYVNTWLPDLGGTNYTTAKDMAVMLYNIDNSSFLSLHSREQIISYLSHVKNNRLIQAGLPNNAILIHKTGDIGNMLGDAGIVWTQNGKKYIVVIMAKRPYNNPLGKEFIVEASKIIYDSFSRGLL